MKVVLSIIAIIIYGWMAAYFHESDMEKNCKKYGNAKAFIFEIKCNEMKEVKELDK